MKLPWRLIVHRHSDGPWNMAVDETLLESYAEADAAAPPTLRLYGWNPPTLSLGSRQRAKQAHDADFLRSEGIGLVRRATGGRAVLHEHERTYAVVGRLRQEPFPEGVIDTYRRIAQALATGLAALGVNVEEARERVPGPGPSGPALCFDRPSSHEIVVGGKKLAGSAQLRRKGAFMQHGSILVRADPTRLGRAVGASARGIELTDLITVLGELPGDDEIDRCLIEGFAETFGADFQDRPLGLDETLCATRLRAWKYQSAAWTYEGVTSGRAMAPE